MPLTDSYSSTTTADLNQRGFHHEGNGCGRVSATEEAAVPRAASGCSTAAAPLPGTREQLQKGFVSY